MKSRIFQAREGSVAVPIFPIAENRKLRHRRLNIEFKVQIKRVGGIKNSASSSPRIKPSVYVSLFVKFSLAFSSLAFATSFPLMH